MSGVRRSSALASGWLAGCGGVQSMVDPAGPQARALDDLWWLFVAVCAAVYLLVMAALATAILRRRGSRERVDADLAPAGERGRAFVVAAATGGTVVVLFLLMGASFSTGRMLSTPPSGPPLSIRVIGHQWWWELRYEAETPSDTVTTANEMHLPTGRPVILRLSSVDVIHSLWIPNLQGKRDLIPGRTTAITLLADRPGTYRGQCAEFCGTEHALMALDVIVEPPTAFDTWLAHQRSPAATPRDSDGERGRQVFLQSRCPACHAINGTDAYGLIGPNLTHLASRRSLAAGTLPNTRGHRAGWIVDPQGVKPGVRMPANELPPDDLHALLAYLDDLE